MEDSLIFIYPGVGWSNKVVSSDTHYPSPFTLGDDAPWWSDNFPSGNNMVSIRWE